MIEQSKSRLALIAFSVIALFAAPVAAQEQKKKDPPAQQEEVEPDSKKPDMEEALRQAISGLANQLGLLTSELRRLRQENERNASLIELLLYEERLDRLEEKIQGELEYKNQLDAREQEYQRRLRNVPAEAALRGGLRKEETEAALRAGYQQAIEDTRAQQEIYQGRISELQSQADRIRKRVEALRKKLEPPEEKKP
jgi:hypothetical protein